jgi:hypothetical protein
MHKMMKVGQTEKKMSKRLWYDRDFSSYADIEWMNVELSGSNMAIATILYAVRKSQRTEQATRRFEA